MRIPFVGGSYEARSLNADAQRSVNCYVEMDNASPRAPIALYGTPGTALKFTLPTGPVRSCIPAGGYLWCLGCVRDAERFAHLLGGHRIGRGGHAFMRDGASGVRRLHAAIVK